MSRYQMEILMPRTRSTATDITSTVRQVEANVPDATEILRQGLEAWLGELKAAAGARPCPRG
ncbi:hypothetical protein [Streptomyces globisporus]|uniref:hypothetical protein n=2 Tax=Streptomyces TaxID=1883 RepID=UPI003CC809CD